MPDDFPVANCSDLVIVRCSKKLNPYFLAYYVNSIAAQHVDLHLVGAVQQHFNVGSARKIVLRLPDIREQHAIVDVLRALDGKIELNRRMNETLEATAQALFKSWFIDFDPIRAKVEGHDPGLPSHIVDLFPDFFVGSELEAIPNGWMKGSILAQADLLSGGTPKTECEDYWGGGVSWASAKDVSQSRQTFLIETERNITERGLEESATQLIPKFSTVIVARGATTGRMVLFGREMAMNQTCYALTSKTATPFALYCHISHKIENLVRAAHGSVFDTITTSTFKGAQLILPQPDILKCFERIVEPIFLRILASTQEQLTLCSLRDSLLPKLISGELHIKDAARLIKRANA